MLGFWVGCDFGDGDGCNVVVVCVDFLFGGGDEFVG